MIDFTVKKDKISEVTVEEAQKHKELIDDVEYLIKEGFIDYEEGIDGEIRLYPAS